MKRTHTNGELTKKNEGKEVFLQGWCNSRRDHGGVIFIDLRDRYGLTQIVFEPDCRDFKEAEKLRREDVIEIKGKVRPRPKGMQNPKLSTGEIEVLVSSLTVLNKAETPPLEVEDRVVANEDMRLKYRYVDLRRPVMQKNLIMRHKIVKATRDYFDKLGFVEIETPIMAKSTPEGARDYLVPSRIFPGSFYALPQSPQLFKQLLMISGFDRYVQIAKCFRDEDLRADRQPEFTQIDLEMSFIDEEDIYEVMEGMIKAIFKVINVDVKTPFPRISYFEAMDKYGVDRPDTRFGLELIDITDVVKDCDFEVFTRAIKAGGKVKCINAKGCGNFSRKYIEGELTDLAGVYGAKGMAWMKMEDKLESSIVKFFSEDEIKKLIEKTKAQKGDLLLFVADYKHFVVNDSLGNLRLMLAKKLNLIKDGYSFVWVNDFPLVEYDEDEERHIAVHHPFTSPKDEDMALLEKDPSKARAKAYDLVLNGTEIGGGSIRIHKKEIQEKMFKVLGISKEEAGIKFGFLLDAFKYGAPPHGGIAFGLDRLVALMTGNESIREVIAFPKNKAAQSLMEGSPSDIEETQLKELHIKMDVPEKKARAVLFDRIRAALDAERIEYEVIEHKPVYTSREAAEVRGTELKQGCKALIVKADDKFVQAVVSGAKEIDLEKLKKFLNAGKVELANAAEVKNVSGCDIGAVPPFGNLFDIDVYFDKSVAENKEVAFNAGLHTKSIKMEYKDLLKVTGGKEGEFSR